MRGGAIASLPEASLPEASLPEGLQGSGPIMCVPAGPTHDGSAVARATIMPQTRSKR